jgi:hypothetical protein
VLFLGAAGLLRDAVSSCDDGVAEMVRMALGRPQH